MKSDFLFTTWNCSKCSELKMKINDNAIYDDDVIGKEGQNLSLINSFSNTGTISILEKFKFPKEAITPALYTHKNNIILTFEDIEKYLKEQGFLND